MDSNMLVTMTVEDLRKIVSEEVQKAVEHLSQPQGVIKQLPALLTREEFMEVMHISSTTATKIFDRPDFQVIRGRRILIETEFLMKWVRKNSEWVGENTNYFRSIS